MNIPKLDGRTAADILALIGRKSGSYTPEWRFDPQSPDGGTALAILFSEMFCGTIDRLDRFPDKCSLEFLNMLGVSAKPVSPAVGTAAARIAEGAEERVYIKKGTQLFTDRGEERIVFETSEGFFAVPAKLTDIFMTTPAEDVITRTEIPGELPVKLFRPQAERNLERHCFTLSNGAVLRLDGAAEIMVKFGGTSGLRDVSYQEALSSENVKWSIPGENGVIPLEARPGADCVILSKPEGKAVPADENGVRDDENGRFRIMCEMTRSEKSEFLAADIAYLSCRGNDDPETLRGRLPDRLYSNDTELPQIECGYVFGREPSAYDSLYIACDEAFSKAGAQITVDISVGTVVVQNGDVQSEPQFDQKLVVDKGDLRVNTPDDVYISGIVWEYWNGTGWARLEVSGDVNPFSCAGSDGRRRLSFTCPEDFQPSVQNAYSGLWLRARIREVHNRFSMNARWLLPLVKSIELRFDYGAGYVPAETVTTLNSCRRNSYEMSGTRTRMELFSTMPDSGNTVYMRFDKAPAGLPVNLYMDFEGETDVPQALKFSYYSGGQNGGWRELRAVDRTGGFCAGGIISLYAPDDFARAEFFGVEGYWIRAEEPFGAERSRPVPPLTLAEMNAVRITQKTTVTGERRTARAGAKYQSITLSHSPVIECAVWVNELGETPVSELQELLRDSPADVRVVNGDDGLPAEWWVRWRLTENLGECAGDVRCFELDSSAGKLTFGDGACGRIPAYTSDAEMIVDYSWGGGTAGNLPAGALDGLITGIPFIESMTNILPTCGGSAAQSLETIRRIGAQRIRHGGRAVTARDHESLVMEEFSEVGEVKCFPGRNRRGEQQGGCVTLVVKPAEMGTPAYAAELCRRVEAFLRERACGIPAAGGGLAVVPAKPLKISAEVSVVIKDIAFAAQTEREAAEALSRLTESRSARIGAVPCESDVYAALRNIGNIAYTSKVLLTGEYSQDGEVRAIPLDRAPEYKYFLPETGVHTVRIDGAAGI